MFSVRKFSPLLFIVCLFSISLSQVTFVKMPQKLQLYGRNLATDSADVAMSGKVNRTGANYQEIRVRIYRDNVLKDSVKSVLAFTGDTAYFDLHRSIRAELNNYRFTVYGYNGTQETLLRTADSVVCGDAFIITGQSNSVAFMRNGSSSANQSPFIRVYGSGNWNGSDSAWHIGQGDGDELSLGNTGQWGLRMARNILDSQNIPVAVFNGGHGGQPIAFFTRNDTRPADPTTNYGRLLIRVGLTGLAPGIRAILWHQVEWNSGNPTESYKTAFVNLTNSWKKDYPNFEKVYLFQLRNGCGGTDAQIMTIKEAQRQLGKIYNFSTMSTSAQTSDDCHFPYLNGYKSFGDNIYCLMARDLYGKNAGNINPPSIKFAELAVNGLVVYLIMEDILDSLTWAATGAEKDFKLEGTTVTVMRGTMEAGKVKLALSGYGTAGTGISYYGHHITPDPMVTNLNGVGALHFYNYPFTTPRYRDSVSVMAILRANGLTLPLDSVATSGTSQRITGLDLANLKLSVVPGDIGYMDSLKTIDLSGNLLISLPREITKLKPSMNVQVNLNYLCTVSDTIKTWINTYAKDVNWSMKQLKDSVHFCDGGIVAVIHGSPVRTSYSAGVDVGFAGYHRLIIRFRGKTADSRVNIISANGRVMASFATSQDMVKIDVSRYPRSVYLVQVIARGRSIVEKVTVF